MFLTHPSTTTVLSTIIFFITFVQMLYYLGVMQWIIKNFAWFFKTMNVSSAEAVVAAASPFLGQGESACLVRPSVDIMTESEMHLVMTTGKPSVEWQGVYLSIRPFKDSPPSPAPY